MKIVPSSKAFSVKKLIDACDYYAQQAGTKKNEQIMIEYICIGGVNDTPEVAHQLGALLEGKNMWVNLIPYNPTDAGDRFGFKSPKDEDLVIFSRIIQEYDDAYGKRLKGIVRWSTERGREVDAACGQLALKNLDEELMKKSSSNGCSTDGNGNNDNNDNINYNDDNSDSNNNNDYNGNVKDAPKDIEDLLNIDNGDKSKSKSDGNKVSVRKRVTGRIDFKSSLKIVNGGDQEIESSGIGSESKNSKYNDKKSNSNSNDVKSAVLKNIDVFTYTRFFIIFFMFAATYFTLKNVSQLYLLS